MDKIILTPLKHIHNPKGDIFHAIRKSDNGFDGFGEAYFSTVKQGIKKGWKKHTEMTLNLIVVIGEIEFVIYDEYTKEYFNARLSHNNYQRLTVKSGLWMAFRGIDKYNMLLNLANIEHDPKENEKMSLDTFNYNWENI